VSTYTSLLEGVSLLDLLLSAALVLAAVISIVVLGQQFISSLSLVLVLSGKLVLVIV